MADSLDAYLVKRNAIGEVASLRGGKIDVFVFPDKYRFIKIGQLIIIKSQDFLPIGMVLKLIHETRTGSFIPLGMERTELEKYYPDLKEYEKFVTTISYVGYLHDGIFYSHRSSSPMLHDLAFLLPNRYLEDILFNNNMWNFDFLRYFIMEGASPIELYEFLVAYRNFWISNADSKVEIVRAIANSLKVFDYSSIEPYLTLMLQFFESI